MLNQTVSVGTDAQRISAASSTNFSIGNSAFVNNTGDTYVAYVFAHDDQSFGTNSDEAIIKCGSYTATGSPQTIDLGFQPQFLITKKSSGTGEWRINDIMRGIVTGGADAQLDADSSAAELTGNVTCDLTATGFITNGSQNDSGSTYIYIAIRRPHKPPSAGTDVFASQTNSPEQSSWTPGFAPDALFTTKPSTTSGNAIGSRLTGTQVLRTDSTQSEETLSGYWSWDEPTGTVKQGYFQSVSDTGLHYAFKRAPSFFDTVAYDALDQLQQLPITLKLRQSY